MAKSGFFIFLVVNQIFGHFFTGFQMILRCSEQKIEKFGIVKLLNILNERSKNICKVLPNIRQVFAGFVNFSDI